MPCLFYQNYYDDYQRRLSPLPFACSRVPALCQLTMNGCIYIVTRPQLDLSVRTPRVRRPYLSLAMFPVYMLFCLFLMYVWFRRVWRAVAEGR